MVSTLPQPVASLSSPTLRSFETNPFRVLRLPVNATTSEASFQAERVLTLVRAELPPEEPDPLPWLPPADIYEIQQAAQSVEEPLLRLTEQLLWFDFVRDTAGATLQLMLREMKDEELRKHLEEETWLPEAGECDPADRAGVPLVAQAINQANLRLLMAASMMNGAITPWTTAPVELGKITRSKWQTLHGLTVLPEAHNVIADTVAGGDSSLNAQYYWEGALKRWARILGHPWFTLYVSECIADLKDDFTSTDDIETIEESIRTRLADLSVKETRFLLLEGRYPLAGAMISSVSRSGFEKRILGPALRPIHNFFQSEISELQPLLDESEEDEIEYIDAYLKRLEVIKQRWSAIDKSGLIGLSNILDDAVEQAYLRLRNRSQPSAELDTLLVKATSMATAQSLRERVNFYRKELEEAKSRICHFCKTEDPDYEKSVVLEGKKVTKTEYSGNTITTYYGVRYGIVLRCARCARLHDFVGKVGLLALLVAFPGLACLLLPILASSLVVLVPEALSAGRCAVYLLVMAAFAGYYLIQFMARNVLLGVRYTVAIGSTPPGHTRYGTYKDTEAYRSLRADGYDVKAHWKSNAVSSLENKN